MADEDLWRVTDSSDDADSAEDESSPAREERKESAPAALNSASSGAKNNPDLTLAAGAGAATNAAQPDE